MKVYTVHEPAHPASDRIDRAAQMVFVPDGFNWGAALVPPLKLGAARCWLGLAIYIGAVTVAVALLRALGADAAWTALAVIAIHLFVGFEYSEVIRANLEASGWSTAGTVAGNSRAECERRFFEFWLPGQPLITALGREQQHQQPHAGPAAAVPVAAPTSPPPSPPTSSLPGSPLAPKKPRWKFW